MCVCLTTVTVGVARSKPGQHKVLQTGGNHGLSFMQMNQPASQQRQPTTERQGVGRKKAQPVIRTA